jgi:protein phosphatase
MKLFFKRQDEPEEEISEEAPEILPEQPQEITAETAEEEALPEAPEVVSPSPLVAGAFLNSEWEILQLTRRGAVNFYQATDSDFNSSRRVQIAQQSANENCYADKLKSTLWQPLDVFTADDCDYAVFRDSEFRVLNDWRESPNDERYLIILQDLVEGLCEWKEHHLIPGEDDLWGVDEDSNLHYYGFLQQEPEGVEWDYDAVLRGVNQKLLKQVFAPTATMRLDDPWSAMPFCVETIDLIRAIQEEQLPLAQCRERIAELSPSKVLLVDAALLTDVGQERELNEDSGAILHLERQGQLHQNAIDLWIVADGMGGHEGGEVASDLTVSSLQKQLLQNAPDINWDDNAAVRNSLFEMVQIVNRGVFELGASHKGRSQPGSTLVAALRLGRRLFVINVGDSRAYLWSEKRGLTRVSKDHSYVQTLIDQGELTPEEAFGHPQGNIITAHIGMKKLEECDVFMRYVSPGDRLVLVSDGVVDMLPESEITALITTPGATELCETLVNASNDAGGADNITALVADFDILAKENSPL